MQWILRFEKPDMNKIQKEENKQALATMFIVKLSDCFLLLLTCLIVEKFGLRDREDVEFAADHNSWGLDAINVVI